MKVMEIMSKGPQCVRPQDKLIDAASVMKRLDVGAVPICDHDKLAGMLTDRDIAVRAVAEGRNPRETTVGDVMSSGIVYVFEDQDVTEAADIMEKHQIRRVPVLNQGKRLVGILSLGDIATTAGTGLSGEALREVSQPSGTH